MISISFDETHHIKNNKPLYDRRYKRVMSFHNGIAPVENENESFFINEKNEKQFNMSFIKAYGFYDGLSAVKDKNGWFHIDLDGNEVYSQRYKWVGNFNENKCSVRSIDDKYFHIDIFGKKLYEEEYSYVGDFKYNIAVVIDKNGKSTHIDENGNLIHNKYFDELNIFHKGFAIAKDTKGYFHINKNGDALYDSRYKKLEDFYNGFALATTFDNNKIILNEEDYSTFLIANPEININEILEENFSFFKYQILFSILKLDILKELNNIEDIDLPSISKKLILRWLYVEELIDEENNLTKKGLLIENKLKPIILYWQDLPFKTITHLVDSLKEGSETFTKLFGEHYFDFLANNKECLDLSQKINDFYNIDYSNLIKYMKLKNEIVCDIGGGSGSFINQVLNIYKDIKPIVIDKYIDTNNINSKRIDFFEEYKIYADVFLLCRVLHDWEDNKAIKILQNISNNMTSNNTLYLLETIVPVNSKNDKGITLSFHLLNFVGGYERTKKDFENILKKANLYIKDIHSLDSLISLIEVRKNEISN